MRSTMSALRDINRHLFRFRRLIFSAVVGVLFAILNFWLLITMVDAGYNKFLVNFVISIFMLVIWYFINLWLWREQEVKTSKSAGGSVAWWIVSFGLHQATFGCAVGLVGIPYTIVRGTQYGVGVPEFFLKYWVTREFFFGFRSVQLKLTLIVTGVVLWKKFATQPRTLPKLRMTEAA